MKRFLVFVIISIITLGIGFTVFRFMSKDEILYVTQTVFEVNSGENIKLDIVKENLKSNTTITAESNNDSIVEKVDDFEFKAKNGGTTTITVTSNKTNFMPVTIQITVGDGKLSTPFYIKDAEALKKIGSEQVSGGETYIYPLTSNYKLTADFELGDETWTPIGANSDVGFTGTFDFNGHRISNLNITSATNGFAGLFATVGNGGYIKGANIFNSAISANANYCGTVAGVNYGRIEAGVITNASIEDNLENAYVGGVVGLNHGTITKTTIVNDISKSISARGNGSVAGGIAGASVLKTLNDSVSITRCSAETSLTAVKAVGGIVGENAGAVVENCYAGALDTNYVISAGVATAGGIVGLNRYVIINSSSPIKSYVCDTYSVMNFVNANNNLVGGIVGTNDNFDADVNYNRLFGNYYSGEINNGINPIGSNPRIATSTELGIYTKNTADLKQRSTYFSFEDRGMNLYWQFDEGVWTIAEDSLPTLSFDINYVSSRAMNYTSANEIDNNNFVSVLSTTEDIQTPYKLTQDIVLKSAEGFTPFEFNGKLYSPLDEDGNPLFKIVLIINTPEGVKDGVAAIFSKLGANAQLTNIKVEVQINTILDADHISAIAGINEGVLDNCSATGTITTEKASEKIYIAGLVAENLGTLNNCKSAVAINYDKTPNLLYVGGIVAYNTNTIQNSTNNGNITTNSSTEAYIGGVVGYSSGAILKSANHGSITGNINANNSYFGGIAGILAQNANARMNYCGSYGEIKGSNVGGLVGISMGAINNCYSSASITGVKIGGLAYNIKQGTETNPSYMSNCMTDGSQLYGENSNSVVCGVVYQIDVIESHLAYCHKIFSSSKFSGEGKFYYESSSNIRGKSSWGQASYIDENAFNNSIHVERAGNIERQNANFDTLTWDTWTEWSMWLKGKHDITVTEEQAKGSDGYKTFTENNYNVTDWEFEIGEYPMLKNVAK